MTDSIKPSSTSVVRLILPEDHGPITPDQLAAVLPQINSELESLQQAIGSSLPNESPVAAAICEAFIAEPVSKAIISNFSQNGSSRTFLIVVVKDKKGTRFAEAKKEEMTKPVKLGTF